MSIDLKLDSEILNFAVFGNPISHSKSPVIHSLFAKQTGIALNYQAIFVPEESLSDYVSAFFLQSGKGLNITVPFKKQAFELCDSLTDRARRAESVNTLWLDEHSQLSGDTTDGIGLISDLTRNHKVTLDNATILILGAGGTVGSIIEPLLNQRPKSLTIVNRTSSKAEAIAKRFIEIGDIHTCGYEQLAGVRYNLVINATSMSLSGELPDLPSDLLHEDACCYDLMYGNSDTVFMRWARESGMRQVYDGLGMLVEQAAESFLRWHGVRPDTKALIDTLRI